MDFSEEWRVISEFPNYEVSNYGRVRNWKGYIKSLKHDRYGYPTVDLYNNSKRTEKLVHRLVANAFIPNPENKPTVNHIDGDKMNNKIDNLEWNTHKENMQHAVRTGLWHYTYHNTKGIKHICKVACGRKPRKIRIVETNEIFENISACAYYLKRSNSSIYDCISNRSHTCAGYHLEYA